MFREWRCWYFEAVIDVAAIKSRFEAVAPFLDERGRRLVAASEALAAGRGGVKAVCEATAVARSTIGRGLAELRGGENHLGGRVRRAGGGRKAAIDRHAGLLEALGELVQSAIRGDPQAALLWVSKSQRHLAGALAERGFVVSHKLVGRLLRRLGFTLQANRKTREGASHPDRDAQFEHINAQVSGFLASGHLGRHQEEGIGRGPSAHGLVPWGFQERRTRTAPQERARAGAGARLQHPCT